jgi:hypothetical protein
VSAYEIYEHKNRKWSFCNVYICVRLKKSPFLATNTHKTVKQGLAKENKFNTVLCILVNQLSGQRNHSPSPSLSSHKTTHTDHEDRILPAQHTPSVNPWCSTSHQRGGSVSLGVSTGRTAIHRTRRIGFGIALITCIGSWTILGCECWWRWSGKSRWRILFYL